MKIFYVILWLVSVFFLSPGALYQKRTELPRMVMEAADSVVVALLSMVLWLVSSLAFSVALYSCSVSSAGI